MSKLLVTTLVCLAVFGSSKTIKSKDRVRYSMRKQCAEEVSDLFGLRNAENKCAEDSYQFSEEGLTQAICSEHIKSCFLSVKIRESEINCILVKRALANRRNYEEEFSSKSRKGSKCVQKQIEFNRNYNKQNFLF